MEPDRYSRQVLFPGIGAAGQQRIRAAKVAVVGCGALGSFQAGALARAGVGRILLIDRDYVEWSNLQRQWLYDESDARDALPKAIAAARRLAAINSEVEVSPLVADLTAANIEEALEGVNLILDGTDNFETRYLLNDYAVSHGVPWIYGAAVGSYGLTMPVLPGKTACLKCVYPEPPSGAQPTCETAGVLNAITSAIASLQTGDALKILAGHADSLRPRITTVDVWSGEVRQVALPPPDAGCQACGWREFVHLEGKRRAPISLCGRNAVQIHERAQPLDLGQLKAALEPLGEVRANEFALRFFLPPYEMTIFPDGRAIIKGTDDVGLARSLYARYVGA
ncbi:MAG TPA: ThiF family adenylyltransferase [Bryobacteraceae bacterium]|nr:ThiF family adenylyltransferase [Bryobacteraceae bacterium]HOQ43963.1 ThiF family adenylyltransferase [Bryobacteraceae bacterium]HPU72941.1 ThiF family adenylyltransferase [Bryobacteraceae bacterium]